MVDVRQIALDFGFADVKIIKPIQFTKWKEHVDYLKMAGHIVPTSLHHDPYEVFSSVKSIVVLMNHYVPFKGWGSDNIQVHPYYITANRTYKLGQKMGEKLTELGIGNTTRSLLPTRHAAFAAGYGTCGIMGPLINKTYGSYLSFKVIMIDIEQEYDELISSDMQGCDACNKCLYSCDNDAIQVEGRVFIERCYRHYAPGEHLLPKSMRRGIGMRFLGCGDCQDICPHNDSIKPVTVPTNVLEATYLPDLLDYKHIDWKKRLKVLGELVGTNLARPSRTLAQCALHAGNTLDKKYIPLLRESIKHPNEMVQIYSAWSLKKLGDSRFLIDNGLGKLED